VLNGGTVIDPMHAIEMLKDAAKVAQKLGQLGLQKQILEAEDEVRELTREKRHLEDKVEELERKLTVKAAMTFKAPFFYQRGDATPFCPS
jgi:chromosome segregation ATPase